MTETAPAILNPYYKSSKIAAADFEVLLHQFCIGGTAADAATASGVSLRSVKAIFNKLRQRVGHLQLYPKMVERDPSIPLISVGWNYFVKSNRLEIVENWCETVSDLDFRIDRPADPASVRISGCKGNYLSDQNPAGQKLIKICHVKRAMEAVISTRGIKITDESGRISQQCWEHLVAETWRINHIGCAYQTLKAALLTVPLSR